MTRLFFTLTLVAISVLGFSQLHTLPLSEDFSNMQLPTDWQELGTWNYDNQGETFPTQSNGYIVKEMDYPMFGMGSDSVELYTPFIDVSAVANTLKLSMYYSYETQFSTFCNMLITVDGGLNWDTIQHIQTSNGINLNKDLTSFIAGADSMQIRFSLGYQNAGSGSGSSVARFAFDDLLIQEPVARDLGVLSINTPNSGCENSDTVNITVFNYGTDVINEQFTLSYSVDNGTTWVDENLTRGVSPNHGFDYTFTTPVNLDETNTSIITKVTISSDGNISNNEKEKPLSISPSISAFPYNADFENDNANWYADNSNNGSWAWGAPNSTELVGGANSSANAWATNLTGTHNLSEESYLYSPCFNFSGLTNPDIEFDIWYQSDGQMYGNYSGLIIEYSTDDGNNWATLGSNYSGGINWYDYPQGWYGIEQDWKHAKHNMVDLANEPKVNFRFHFKSFNQPAQEGYAIDNIFIHEAFANDLSVTAINTPLSSCDLSDETVNITVANLGTNDVSSFDIEYTIDGTNWITESITQTITAGNDADIDFTQTVDLSAYDVYTIQARVVLTGDQNNANDEASIDVVSQPTLSGTEIFEDFENTFTSQFWIKDEAWNSTANDWELGAPAYSGTKAWVTNADGNYNTNQEAYVVSPCMDISSITNPAIEFYLNNNVGPQANFNVQYSVDGGTTWAALGSVPTSNPHWYNAPYASFTFTTQGFEAKRRTITDINAIATNPESVKFRFVFTSADGTPNVGSAFDDFKIYQDDTLALTSNVNNIIEADNGFTIYPNPATNQITINNVQLTVENIKILDITGKICKSNILVRKNTIDISNLQNGVYFIKVGNEVSKFVKE